MRTTRRKIEREIRPREREREGGRGREREGELAMLPQKIWNLSESDTELVPPKEARSIGIGQVYERGKTEAQRKKQRIVKEKRESQGKKEAEIVRVESRKEQKGSQSANYGRIAAGTWPMV